MKPIKSKIFGRVEKASIIVISILAVVNLIIKEIDIAVGIVFGGLLFIIDFVAIKFLVNSIIGKKYSIGFSMFLFLIKFLILLAILALLLMFAKLNIYGFIIALTAIVFVIVGSSLKDKNGAF